MTLSYGIFSKISCIISDEGGPFRAGFTVTFTTKFTGTIAVNRIAGVVKTLVKGICYLGLS